MVAVKATRAAICFRAYQMIIAPEATILGVGVGLPLFFGKNFTI
jgi:hypothetical protein